MTYFVAVRLESGVNTPSHADICNDDEGEGLGGWSENHEKKSINILVSRQDQNMGKSSIAELVMQAVSELNNWR